MKKLTQSEFIEKAKTAHEDKYDYSKVNYINSRTKVCIICPAHGEFWQTPASHIVGKSGCPECGKVKEAKYTKNESEERCFAVHGDKYTYSFTGGEKQRDYIDITCKKHNYTFRQALYHHLRGSGCPICNNGRLMNTNEFIIRAKEVHGEIYDYSKVNYLGKEIPITIICPVHGEFTQKPHNHINGDGCPYCKSWKTQYRIYKLLKESFPEEKWLWEYSAPWLGKQKIDIYNERIKLAIEYNGEQHYVPVEHFGGKIEFEKRLILDNKKKDILKKQGCTLYIIKYDEFDPDKVINDIKTFLNYEN